MIDYNSLIQASRDKYLQFNGGHANDVYDYNRDGFETISLNSLRSHEVTLTKEQIDTCQELTICTSVMNRTEHLLESLPTWLRLPFKRIVVLDWSSDVSVSETLKNQNTNDPRLDIIRLDGKKYYHQAGAKNEKIKHCDGWLLCIDSDIMLSPYFGKCINIPKNKNVIYVNNPICTPKELQGTAIIHKDEFDKVGGFDELFVGWGAEDITLYEAMTDNGCTLRDFTSHTAYHIPHDDFARMVNVKHESIYESLVDANYKRSIEK